MFSQCQPHHTPKLVDSEKKKDSSRTLAILTLDLCKESSRLETSESFEFSIASQSRTKRRQNGPQHGISQIWSPCSKQTHFRDLPINLGSLYHSYSLNILDMSCLVL